MTYEVCGLPDPFGCSVHMRTSTDGWSWGDASDIGTLLTTSSGQYFTHTPVLAVWAPGSSSDNAVVVVTAQMFNVPGGALAANSGGVYLVATLPSNSAPFVPNGSAWAQQGAAVDVPWPSWLPLNNYCPNYSPAVVVLAHSGADVGATPVVSVFEVSTTYVGTTLCTAFFNTTTLAV